MTRQQRVSPAVVEGEDPTDALFRADADAKGYLVKGGRGLFAYYRDHGMIAPGDLPNIYSREVTGLDLERPIDDEVDE